MFPACVRWPVIMLCMTPLLATPLHAEDTPPLLAPATCSAKNLQIKVVISGVTAQGLLTVELYEPSETEFLRKGSRLSRVRVPATDGTQTICFDVPQPGPYAVAAYQDLDSNGKLARKLSQLPAEPFALSNGKVRFLRFPKFEDAAFMVEPTGAEIRMTLQR